MKRSLLAATALSTSVMFLVPGAGLAQSTFDWTGFYAGVGIGGATSKSTLLYDYSGPLSLPTDPIAFIGGGSTVSANFGHNWQAGTIVYGLEADGNLLAFRGSLRGADYGTGSGADYSADERITALLSLRGRLGYAADRFLVFGTAGIGAGQASFNTDVGKGTAGAHGIVMGPVVGAGVEYALNDNLTIKAQGKLYNLSPLTAVGDTGKGEGPDPYTATYTPRPVVFEAGINVHF
jgi:outer membrane immunogenic protein